MSDIIDSTSKNVFNEKKKSYSKSVDKIFKKLNDIVENIDIKYMDDTKLKIKLINNNLSEELNDSQENDETSASKQSKESLGASEKNESENSPLIFITKENSLEIITKGKKKFKNLETNHISHNILKIQEKKNRVKKEIKISIIQKEEEYDENTKYNFLSKMKPKGLLNLGGCCYMNATLQCFYHIKELTYYFLDNKKKIKRKKDILI